MIRAQPGRRRNPSIESVVRPETPQVIGPLRRVGAVNRARHSRSKCMGGDVPEKLGEGESEQVRKLAGNQSVEATIEKLRGLVQRHGDHVGQEGTPEGGSQPGYTHAEGSVGGGEGKWNPEDDNTIVFGRKLSLDEEVDLARGEEFEDATIEALRAFYEKTGIKPRGLTITNSYLDMADTILAGEEGSSLNRFELAGILFDRARHGSMGMYAEGAIWMLDNAPEPLEIGSDKWNSHFYHELGHWLHNDIIGGVKNEVGLQGLLIEFNREIEGTDQYIKDALALGYAPDTDKLRREYVADLTAAIVNQPAGETPRFYRYGQRNLNETEVRDMNIVKRYVERVIRDNPDVARFFVRRQKNPDDRLLVIGPDTIEWMTREEMESWSYIPDTYDIIDPANIVPLDVRDGVDAFMYALRSLFKTPR